MITTVQANCKTDTWFGEYRRLNGTNLTHYLRSQCNLYYWKQSLRHAFTKKEIQKMYSCQVFIIVHENFPKTIEHG